SPCSQGVSSTKDPKIKKHTEEQIALLSVPDQDWTQALGLVPGRHKGCPLLLAAREEGQLRMGEKQRTNSTGDIFSMRVSVCVSPPNARVCCVSCCVAK